ncbi:MAG: hypothetical protein IT233_00655 [Bacteroidia bacterium]|nr:hypothetical protein [Bacteroidia bacterium]
MENAPVHIEQPQVQPPIQEEKKINIKEIVIYSAVGLILVGGSIYLGSKLIRTGIANTEEKKSLDTTSASTTAKQLKMAFDNDGWWGTDEESLRRILRSIPTKDFYKEVAGSYKKLYASPLTKDMQDELTSTEYEEMMMIVASKPEKKGDAPTLNYLAWAKRIRAAVSVYYGIFPGTDEDAIKSVFLEIPTQDAYKKVQAAYVKEFGDTLMYDLEGDLSQDYIDEYLAIIKKKPKS